MKIVWLEPWRPIDRPEEQQAIQSELRSELSVSHPLFGLSVVALARRDDQDDVLFELADSRVAEVHLTWTRKPERDPPWPKASIFASGSVWAEERMRLHHEETKLFR